MQSKYDDVCVEMSLKPFSNNIFDMPITYRHRLHMDIYYIRWSVGRAWNVTCWDNPKW